MNFQPLYPELAGIAPDDPLLARFKALCEANNIEADRFNVLANLTLQGALQAASGQPLTLDALARAFAEHAGAYGIGAELREQIEGTMRSAIEAGITEPAPEAAEPETTPEEVTMQDHVYPIVNPPLETDEERQARTAYDAKRAKQNEAYAMMHDPRYSERGPAGDLYRREVEAKFAEVFGNDAARTSERGLGV